MSFSRRTRTTLKSILTSPDSKDLSQADDFGGQSPTSSSSSSSSFRSPRLIRQELALQTALDAVEEMSRLHAKARIQEEEASAAHVAALESVAKVAQETAQETAASSSNSPSSYPALSPRRYGFIPRLSSSSPSLSSPPHPSLPNLQNVGNLINQSPSQDTLQAMNDLSVARKLLEDAENRLQMASSTSSSSQSPLPQYQIKSPMASSSSPSTFNNTRNIKIHTPRVTTTFSPPSSSSLSSLSPTSSLLQANPPLSRTPTVSASSSSSSSSSSYISPRQHERESLALASSSLRASRTPLAPLDFPTSEEIQTALKTRKSILSSLDIQSTSTSEANDVYNLTKEEEKYNEEDEEAYTAWSALSAGQQADILGISKNENPYMHASFSLMRIHPRVIALRRRQLLPPLYTPPLLVGIATQRSSVAAALDRLSLPSELIITSSSSSTTTTTTTTTTQSNLRTIFNNQYQSDDGISVINERRNGDNLVANAAMSLSESSANEILASLCKLIGVEVKNDEIKREENFDSSMKTRSTIDSKMVTTLLLPRVRALAAAAVSASVLHHFAGIVCSKLSSVIAPHSSLGQFGLEDAVTFLDAALSELIALRSKQRVHEEQEQEQQEEENK
jgi:hypothetical protein